MAGDERSWLWVSYLAFALSGAAGLAWELLWVRQIGLAVGGTVVAASLVSAVFLAGLGVGAELAGRIADRLARPTRVWAACELAIALWGLASIPVFHALADAGIGGLAADARGWLVPTIGARIETVALALALLGPPTALMGASLPLLARRTIAGGDPGWRTALLVGANTVGAVVGALATDLALVPTLGIRGTQAVAATLGLCAAAIGAVLPGDVAPTGASAVRADPGPTTALAIAGFAAMGMEVAWLRFFASALGPYRAVFSLVLAVMLTGWLVGGLAVAAIDRRFRATATWFAAAQGSVGTLALAGLFAHDPKALLTRQLALAGNPSELGQLEVDLATVALAILPAAVAMGAAFPLANGLRTLDRPPGRATGGAWLAVTLGNAAGALATGLALLSTLGTQKTVLLLAFVAALAPLPIARRPWAALGVVPVLAFAFLPGDELFRASLPFGRVLDEGLLDVREGLNETLAVTGQPDGPARLWTNGHPMASTSPGAQQYMRLMAHLPLLALESPRRALAICFGVGNTAHAASLHPLERLDIADTSADVLREAPFFAHSNRGVLDDPRVVVHVDDGRHVLRLYPPGTWDLVTLEPPPLAHAGVASLYTREFYALVRDRLAAGGWVTQWLPAYQLPGDRALSLVRAFVDVFPDAVLFVGQGRELVLAGVKGGRPTLDVDAVAARLEERPEVALDLARIGFRDVRDLVATFAADGPTLQAATQGVRPMTDDWPIAESSQVSHVALTEVPASLFAPMHFPGFAPGLADDPTAMATARANAARWSDPDFLRYTTLPH